MAERQFHSASAPFDQSGKIYHLGAGLGDIADTVLLVEDPAHLASLTAGWDAAQQIANVRAYAVYGGQLAGRPITAGCTSSDSHGAATIAESFARLGAGTLIRLGVCTSIRPDLRVGELVVTTGAVRLDMVSRGYVTPSYPAVASTEVLLALLDTVHAHGSHPRVGLVASTDSWYAGQGLAAFGGYQSPTTRTLVPDLQAAGVLAIDPITAPLLTIGGVYGLRVGVVLQVQAEHASGRFVEQDMDVLSAVGNGAAQRLAELDQQRQAQGAKMWHPGLAVRQEVAHDA